MTPFRSFGPLAVSLVLFSCGAPRDRTPSIGQAFVGPTTLGLRQEVSTKSPVTVTLHHGEPLEILEFRRKFIKVRTAGGFAGWTEVQQLMTPDQMTGLRHITERASAYPSQGLASAFELLNVHTEPSRSSPSFLQIPEGGKMDVIGHKIAPRTQAAPPLPAPPPRKRTQRRKSKEKGSARIPPPPMPPGPKLPENWLNLSRSVPVPPDPKLNAAPAAPVRMDDWTLIRTKDGRVGWVLSRMLTMGIPDDVAQYAEGHRITSYFRMGDVQDEDQVKHNWLWTTIGKGPQPYEFDGFRFFTWSKRHHRYETAFKQRDVIGHYPVEVNTTGTAPEFTVILEEDDGKLYSKTFTFNGYRVSLVKAEPYEQPGTAHPPAQGGLATAGAPPQPKSDSWYRSLKARFPSWFRLSN